MACWFGQRSIGKRPFYCLEVLLSGRQFAIAMCGSRHVADVSDRDRCCPKETSKPKESERYSHSHKVPVDEPLIRKL